MQYGGRLIDPWRCPPAPRRLGLLLFFLSLSSRGSSKLRGSSSSYPHASSPSRGNETLTSDLRARTLLIALPQCADEDVHAGYLPCFARTRNSEGSVGTVCVTLDLGGKIHGTSRTTSHTESTLSTTPRNTRRHTRGTRRSNRASMHGALL